MLLTLLYCCRCTVGRMCPGPQLHPQHPSTLTCPNLVVLCVPSLLMATGLSRLSRDLCVGQHLRSPASRHKSSTATISWLAMPLRCHCLATAMLHR